MCWIVFGLCSQVFSALKGFDNLNDLYQDSYWRKIFSCRILSKLTLFFPFLIFQLERISSQCSFYISHYQFSGICVVAALDISALKRPRANFPEKAKIIAEMEDSKIHYKMTSRTFSWWTMIWKIWEWVIRNDLLFTQQLLQFCILEILVRNLN